MHTQNQLIKAEAEALLEKIGMKSDVDVEEQEEGYMLSVDSDENALLIGKHGNTLSSLELVLSLIVAKKAGEYKRLFVEVGGYRKEREQYLQELAVRLKDEVLATGIERKISNLKPWERRLIHLSLSKDDVVTESVGEGRDRVLIIKKK